MKINKADIYKNLMLSAMLKPSKERMQGKEKLYLMGYVPVEISWSNGEKEISTIVNRVSVHFFESIRHLLGKQAEKSMFENNLKTKWIKKLVEKLEGDFITLNKTKKLAGKKIKSIKIISYKKWIQINQQTLKAQQEQEQMQKQEELSSKK